MYKIVKKENLQKSNDIDIINRNFIYLFIFPLHIEGLLLEKFHCLRFTTTILSF